MLNAATSPTAKRRPDAAIHLDLIFSTFPLLAIDRSFVPQRVDRIEQSRLAGGIIAEEQAYSDREQHGDEDGLGRELHGPAEAAPDHEGAYDPQEHARGTPDEAQHHGFAQELQPDRSFRRADGDTHADLPRPLRDRDQHDVHDADAADQERDRGNRDEKDGERA